MPSNKPVIHTRRSIFRRIGRVFLFLLLGIFILLGLVIVLVQTPYIQNIAREKAQTYLSGKLKTKVQIGKLYIGFPQTVELGNIYIEDLQKDTLIAGRSLKVNVNMWKLIHSDIAINKIELEGITAKIKRLLPDTSFNFQFIVNAFAGTNPKPQADKKDTTALKIALDNLLLNKIRLVYNDVVTGNDMEVWIEHSNTKFDKLDLDHQLFGIPLIEMNGIRARVYQKKPLQTPAENASEKNTTQPNTLQLVLNKINLSDIALDYKNEMSALYSNIQLGELKGSVRTFDMSKQLIVLDEIQLNKTTAGVKIGKKTTAEVLNKKAAVVIDSADAGWRFQVAKTSFNDNNIQFDDETKPRLAKGMDFSHIKATGLSIEINNLLYNKDSIAGNITKGSLREQSGFDLKSFHTNFLYTSKQAYLKDLSIQTPGTSIQRSLVVSYPSIEAVQKDLSTLSIDADLQDSRIQLKDILLFVPSLFAQPLFKNSNTVLRINSRVKGTMARLSVPVLQFSGIGTTAVDLSGTIQNVLDPKKFHADLAIKKNTYYQQGY